MKKLLFIHGFSAKKEDNEYFIQYLKKHHNIDRPILSMGMSGSYEQAILCGATMIRPGSLIFGQRSYH